MTTKRSISFRSISPASSIADAMVVASGASVRQVGAMADHLREKLKAAGIKGISIEGLENCDWVLIDSGDVIVHLFRPEVRDFYNLEKLVGSLAGISGRDGGAKLTPRRAHTYCRRRSPEARCRSVALRLFRRPRASADPIARSRSPQSRR